MASDDLPLLELDNRLAPLRRVLGFALRDGGTHVDEIRFLGANGGAWLNRVRDLNLPEPIREMLDAISTLLLDLDALESVDKLTRIGAVWEQLCSVDTVLGLPLEPGERSGELARQGGTREVAKASSKKRKRRKKRSSATKTGRQSSEDTSSSDANEANRRANDNQPSEHDAVPVGFFTALSELNVRAEVLDALEAVDIRTVRDLWLLRAQGEETLQVYGAGSDDVPAGRVAMSGRLRLHTTRISPAGVGRSEALLVGAGPVWVHWAQALEDVERNRLVSGERVVICGHYVPASEGEVAVLEDAEATLHMGHADLRLSTYGIANLSDRVIRGVYRQLVPMLDKIEEPLPKALVERHGLVDHVRAIRDVHALGSAATRSLQRLAFDELFFAQVGLSWTRFQRQRDRGIPHRLSQVGIGHLAQLGVVSLTDDQQLVFEDVKRDLRGAAPMRRLLLGDPGSGKARVATMAVAMVAEGQCQVVWVAPDAATAEMREVFCRDWLSEIGLKTAVVADEPTSSVRAALGRGEIHALFTTPKGVSSGLEWRRLGLAVFEESTQGCGYREFESGCRNPKPDLLMLRPVAGPCALLHTAYPDFDVSCLASTPVEVSGRRWAVEDREAAYECAATRVGKGGRAMVVFALSEGSDVYDLQESARFLKTLRDGVFQGNDVRLLHSSMNIEERRRVINDFWNRRFDVLVCTTPLETGPVFDSVRALVVERADRMPLDRLLRLRGTLPGLDEVHYVVDTDPDESGVRIVDRLIQGTSVEDMMEEEAALWTGLDVYEAPRLRHAENARLGMRLAAREAAHSVLADDPQLRRAGARVRLGVQAAWPDLYDSPCPVPHLAVGEGKRRRRRRRKRR